LIQTIQALIHVRSDVLKWRSLILDCVEQSSVITADEEADLIVALARDEGGHLLHDWAKPPTLSARAL
jgi:hypothetical protein